MDNKINRYKNNDKVSFEKRTLFGSSLVKGVIVSYRFLNYNWIYLVECGNDKKLIVVPEDELWLLEESSGESY
ncbi:MAG: hypothetical protein H6Q69_1167 [Firmicutes bacterium]|uniref:Uncharacterized protein n=1 Tax=Pelosinus fermentans JBW45 TaxID=1192197 RepID=I9NMB6_9FIRM|nr:hypothetical protein [Pelosinus fermentans]AJQ26949.1 hypothetical protein JBW_01599 [Pelosinus fermentans JBW45]MBP2658135.1 hypothetical protein [Bacillota bacterium]